MHSKNGLAVPKMTVVGMISMIEGRCRQTHVLGYLDCCGVQPESGFGKWTLLYSIEYICSPHIKIWHDHSSSSGHREPRDLNVIAHKQRSASSSSVAADSNGTDLGSTASCCQFCVP